MTQELKALADIARQYKSGLAMERAILAAIKSDKPGRGNMFGTGVRFGRGGLYSWTTAAVLDKDGYKSITDLWKDAQHKVKQK